MSRDLQPGVTDYATPNDIQIVIMRVVDAPRVLAFAAWTDPRHVPSWLLGPPGWSMPVCEIDLRPGGSWRYVWRHPDGAEMAMSGSYREVLAPGRVVWTESWGPEWPETVNELVLTESAGRTKCVLTVTYPSKAARDAALESGLREGLDQGFARLDALVESLR